MTSPQFVEWLDSKMAQHPGVKLVPPVDCLSKHLIDKAQETLRDNITDKVMEEARIEEKVEELLDLEWQEREEAIQQAIENLETETRTALTASPAKWWKVPVEEKAKVLGTLE